MAMSRGRVEFYKEHYPAGTRVQLDSMGDDPRPVPSETKGTVLGVCPEADNFHKITEQTESQESEMSM